MNADKPVLAPVPAPTIQALEKRRVWCNTFCFLLACTLLSMGDSASVAQLTASRKAAEIESSVPRRPVRFPELIRVPEATFLMGSPIEDKGDDAYRQVEKPQREVPVAQFWIGRFLVTSEEFCAFLNEDGNKEYFLEWRGSLRVIQRIDGHFTSEKGTERSPARPVTWFGAKAYCEWLSRKLGHEFRLPTEAEWELVARGSELRDWPWGNVPPLWLTSPAHYASLRRRREETKELYRLASPATKVPWHRLYGPRWMPYDALADRMPVGSFALNATPDGVYDMFGYTPGQWCASAVNIESELATTQPARESRRVLRGVWGVKADHRQNLGRLLEALFMGDAVGSHYTYGRSWTRLLRSPQDGALFRVATSHEPHQH